MEVQRWKRIDGGIQEEMSPIGGAVPSMGSVLTADNGEGRGREDGEIPSPPVKDDRLV